MNKVENLFKDKAIIKGGMMLLSKNDAIQFIHECQKENLKILGIDSFLLLEEGIQPSLDNSIDFTASGATKINAFSEALDFVSSIDNKFFFEIVCE